MRILCQVFLLSICLVVFLQTSIFSKDISAKPILQNNLLSSSTESLETGKILVKEISFGKKQLYRLELSENFFATINIEQKDIAINLNIYAHDELYKSITYEELHGDFNPIYLVSTKPVTYFLEVLLPEELKDNSKGIYSIELVELHLKTSQDDQKLFACKSFVDAEKSIEEGNTEAGINDYKKALNVYLELALEKEQMGILFALANAYKTSAQYEQALAYYNQSLSLAAKLKILRMEGRALSSIGVIYKIFGEYQKALDHFQKALEKNEISNDNDGLSQTFNNFGTTYTSLGEYSKSIQYLEKALTICEKMINYQHLSATYNNLAVSNARMKDYVKAIQYLEKGLDISIKANFLYGQGSFLTNLGAIYERQNNYEKAIEYYEKASFIHQKIGDRETHAIVLSNMGTAYQKLGNRSLAIEFYIKALQIHQELRLRKDEAITLQRIAQLQKEEHRLNEAKASMERALTIIESTHQNILVQDLRRSHFSLAYDYYKNYVDILMALHKQNPDMGYNILAFEASEKSRGRNTKDLLIQNKLDLNLNIDNNLIQEEKELKEKITEKASEILKVKVDGSKAKVIEKELEELELKYQIVESKIKESNPNYLLLVNPKNLTLTEIQDKVLDDNTILLEYCLGTEKSYLWVVSKKTFNSFELEKSEIINTLATNIHKNISQFFSEVRLEKNVDKALKLIEQKKRDTDILVSSLSEMIIFPAKDLLTSNKKILVVPDEKLYYVPFASLIKNIKNSKTSLLIEEHEIINILSASTLFSQRQYVDIKNVSQQLEVTLVGDPIFAHNDERVKIPVSRTLERSDEYLADLTVEENGFDRSMILSRLPFSRKEIVGISSLTKTYKTKILTDYQANLGNISDSDLNRSKYIHFASHAIFGRSNPKLNGIVLSLVNEQGKDIDGFLSFEKILSMKLNAEMVVLSACQTALGKEVKGEGLVSLGRAFAYAGAKRTVISLWKVDDEATSEFMLKFYHKLLKEGMSPSTALRKTQIEMLKSKKWEIPYFWAAFIIEGEPN